MAVMRETLIAKMLLLPLFLAVGVGGSFTQAGDGSESKPAANRVEPLLQAIAAGKKLPSDAKDRVPDLIAIVGGGELQECELAIRVLALIGPEASPAIAAISKRLGDPTHSVRGAAVDALAAIGDPCVVPVRNLLKAPAGRTRASAAQVLSRLKRLDLPDLAGLAKDSDPRVRGTAANALSGLGKPGVPLLASLLQDPDLAVAAEAARALQANRADASIAIPALIKALPRAELGRVAVDALSAYGMAARQAIPAIVKAHPLGRGNSDFLDATDEALEHIGPPDVRDIPELCANLKRDEETRMVVAKSLALLGVAGKSAADALEAAAEQSIKEWMEMERRVRLEQRKWPDNSGRVFLAGEYCATAVWDVTHDTPRFLKLIERLAIAAGAPVFDYYEHRTVFPDLTAEDGRLLERMLRYPNINVRNTALAVLSKVGPKAEPIKGTVLELAQGQNVNLSRAAIDTLAAMGPKVGKDATPILLAKVGDGTLPLKSFAEAVGRLEIRSPEAQTILERGLNGYEQWTGVACATALCTTSNEPQRIAHLVINSARAGHFTDRNAIKSLKHLKAGEDVVMPFLVQQLGSTDYWTRHDAINGLGALGPKAAPAIMPLKKFLADESPLLRLKAAQALFLVTGDAAELEKQIEAVYGNDDNANRHHAIAAITELKRSGARFVRYPLQELRRSRPVFAEEAIEALLAIGTEEAVAELRALAGSSDWKLRSQANKALQQLGKPEGK